MRYWEAAHNMLSSTYSTDSVRGYRQVSADIPQPINFQLTTHISDINVGRYRYISDNGSIVVSTNLATANRIGQLTYDIFQTTANLANPNIVAFAPNTEVISSINGAGNCLVFPNVDANFNWTLEINQFGNLPNYSPVSNIGTSQVTRYINCNYNCNTIATTQIIGTNNYCIVYGFDGSNISIEANIQFTNYSPGELANNFCRLNSEGNYLLVIHRKYANANIQIWNKTANVWSREANITTTCTDAMINNYGNIIAINVDATNDYTQIYTKSGNTWSISQNLYSNISNTNQVRTWIDMTNNGNIIISTVTYNANGLSPNNHLQIMQFDNANSNYVTIQNVLLSNTQLNGNPNAPRAVDVAMTKNLGYILVPGNSLSGGGVQVFSCL